MASIGQAVFNSPHFKWEDPYVHINITDSAIAQTPPANTETSSSLMEGDVRCDDKIQFWKEKLGELIVQDYLAIKPGVHSKRKKYYLVDFPQNYVFYVRHVRKTLGSTKKERSDSYLLGGGHAFRSPNEFVFHAAWLMAGAPEGECGCVYCDRDNKGGQRRRNKTLEYYRQNARDRISSARDSGVNIQRNTNVLFKKAFLKDSTPPQATGGRRSSLGEGTSARPRSLKKSLKRPLKRSSLPIGPSKGKRVSFEEAEAGSTSSGGSQVVVKKMALGYDEDSDVEMEE